MINTTGATIIPNLVKKYCAVGIVGIKREKKYSEYIFLYKYCH